VCCWVFGIVITPDVAVGRAALRAFSSGLGASLRAYQRSRIAAPSAVVSVSSVIATSPGNGRAVSP
jgi:hypothetical protein